jgi:hypothetical protein
MLATFGDGWSAEPLTSTYSFAEKRVAVSATRGPSVAEAAAYRVNPFFFFQEDGKPVVGCDRIFPNGGANVAWLGSRVVHGLVDMYLATGDEFFLEQVVVLADRLLNCRLDRRNAERGTEVPDTHRGSATFPGWPSNEYTAPRGAGRVAHAVHSGVFVHALARFVRIVRSDDLSTFRNKADRYLPLLRESLLAFDTERRRTGADAGLYIYPPGHDGARWKIYNDPRSYTDATNVLLPLNMQAAMGAAFVELQSIPGIPAEERRDYRERAMIIARFFKSRLERASRHDAYIWRYWPWGDGDCTKDDATDEVPQVISSGRVSCSLAPWEDVSHGAIDVDFAIATVEADLRVFSRRDIARFGNTLMSLVRNPKAPWRPFVYVNGTGAFDPEYSPDVVYWMNLSRYDRRVQRWLTALMEQPDYRIDSPQRRYDRDRQAYAALLRRRYRR